VIKSTTTADGFTATVVEGFYSAVDDFSSESN